MILAPSSAASNPYASRHIHSLIASDKSTSSAAAAPSSLMCVPSAQCANIDFALIPIMCVPRGFCFGIDLFVLCAYGASIRISRTRTVLFEYYSRAKLYKFVSINFSSIYFANWFFKKKYLMFFFIVIIIVQKWIFDFYSTARALFGGGRQQVRIWVRSRNLNSKPPFCSHLYAKI